MIRKYESKKNIYKLLSEIVKKKQSNDMDNSIHFVKTLLHYVAKLIFMTLQMQDDEFAEIFYTLTEYSKYDIIPAEDRNEINKIISNVPISEICDISFGEMFQSFVTSKEKKYLGQVYTPKHIVKEMVKDGIKEEDIITNPYFKIIDPACGGGYFLLEAYDRIKRIFQDNFEEIVSNRTQLQLELQEGLHSFIIRNILWGTDIDEFAVFMTTISLYLKGGGSKSPLANVFKKDILLDGQYNLFSVLDKGNRKNNAVLDGKFDLVIGNPPYIGHKKIDNSYRKELERKYNDVFMDKADISFCFFRKGYELLKQNGTLLFITSRYFLESPSAIGLRSFLANNLTINKIIDFQGKNVFKGIGISPVVIKCKKEISIKNEAEVYKLNTRAKLDHIPSSFIMGETFNKLTIEQSYFSPEGWILINEDERRIYDKIHSMGDYYLSEVSSCYQGIITGYDSAFIVDDKTVVDEDLEKTLIKPWIKNSNVHRFKVTRSCLNIIYTDLIDNLELFPKVKNHITPYREKLSKRRECLKGIRQWYKLQWGRQLEVFSRPKIVFPFKAETNRFAIVYEEILCSADVYIICIQNKYAQISLEYLAAFLNSSVFEYYFKTVGKKVGEYQYDYYPNKIMNLRVRIGNNIKSIEAKVKELINLNKELEIKKDDVKYNSSIIEMEILHRLSYINNYFYDLYELSPDQVGIIERCIKNPVS